MTELGRFQFPTEDCDLTIVVTHFHEQKPDLGADNPDDYRGYVEIEYDAFGPNGYAYRPSDEEDHAIKDEILRRHHDAVAAAEEDAAIARAEARGII